MELRHVIENCTHSVFSQTCVVRRFMWGLSLFFRYHLTSFYFARCGTTRAIWVKLYALWASWYSAVLMIKRVYKSKYSYEIFLLLCVFFTSIWRTRAHTRSFFKHTDKKHIHTENIHNIPKQQIITKCTKRTVLYFGWVFVLHVSVSSALLNFHIVLSNEKYTVRVFSSK